MTTAKPTTKPASGRPTATPPPTTEKLLVFVIEPPVPPKPTTTPTTPTTTATTTTTTAAPDPSVPATSEPDKSPTTTTVAAVETTIAEPATTEPAPDVTSVSDLESIVATSFTATKQCTRHPSSCEFAKVALADSPAEISMRSLTKIYIDNGLRIVKGFGDYKTRIDSVDVGDHAASATVCALDTTSLFVVGNKDDPNDDILQHQSNSSFELRVDLRQIDGNWGVYQITVVEEQVGTNMCGF